MRPRRQYRLLQAAFVFALVGVAFWGSYIGYRASDYPTQAKADQHAQGIDYPSAVWHWLAHDAAGFFTAGLCVVTGLLAWFTYALYRTTSQLATETREASAAALRASTIATNLARDEFNATHRPELVAREVRWTGGNNAIAFTLANRGRNTCTIVESAFEVTSGKLSTAIRTDGGNPIGSLTLAAGEFRDLSHTIFNAEDAFTAGYHGPSAEELVAGASSGGLLSECLFSGTIIYEDSAGIRRRYVFRRVNEKGSLRFLRTNNPEEEYTD